MRVAFDGHLLGDRDRPGFRHPTYIVTAEIDQHQMLGEFFGIRQQLLFQRAIFFLARAARTGARERTISHHPVLEPGENLASALERCRATAIEHIPVVDSRDSRKVLGEVRQSDLIRAYNRALLDARAQERGET